MIVVVPVDPPREGLVLSSLVDETPLSAADAVALYEASVTDVLRAVADSGGELLVNYRDEETLPEEFVGNDPSDESGDAEAAVRDLVADALEDVSVYSGRDDGDDVRFERQVGSTRAARIGNTVTHLLEREEAGSVGVLEPTAAPVRRTQIDSVAMSARRHDLVLGPASEGEVYLAAFTDPIDFTDAYAVPELATLANRGVDAGLGVGFAEPVPTVATPAGLRTTIATLEARGLAGTPGGDATAAVIEELGLAVGADGSLEFR